MSKNSEEIPDRLKSFLKYDKNRYEDYYDDFVKNYENTFWIPSFLNPKTGTVFFFNFKKLSKIKHFVKNVKNENLWSI